MAVARLNFNQRMQTLELMGAEVMQWGNGSRRSFVIRMRGGKPGAKGLLWMPYSQIWEHGAVPIWLEIYPMMVGPISIEAIMALDMEFLEWLK